MNKVRFVVNITRDIPILFLYISLHQIYMDI